MVDCLARGWIVDLRGDTAIGVAYKDYAGPGFARFADTPDQSFGGENGEIDLHPVALAQVNMHVAPPVRGVAGNNAGGLDFPRRALLKLQQGSKPFVFAVKFRL